jgi:hypothetical protein
MSVPVRIPPKPLVSGMAILAEFRFKLKMGLRVQKRIP